MALTQKDVGLSSSEDLIFMTRLKKLATSGPNQSRPLVLKTADQARAARDTVKSTYTAHLRASTRTKNPIPFDPALELAMRRAEADYVTALSDVYAAKDRIFISDLTETSLGSKLGPKGAVQDIRALIELPQLQGQSPTKGGPVEAGRQFFQLLRSMITNVDAAASCPGEGASTWAALDICCPLSHLKN